MTQPDHPTGPHPALSPLGVLAGEWRWEAVRAGNGLLGRGRAKFEWLEGGAFLLGHSASELPGIPAATIVIGLDDAGGQFTQLYADERGVFRIYQMRFQDGAWELWRDAPGFLQRFRGVFSENGNTITAYWDFSDDGEHWQRDFDLTYRKAAEG